MPHFESGVLEAGVLLHLVHGTHMVRWHSSNVGTVLH